MRRVPRHPRMITARSSEFAPIRVPSYRACRGDRRRHPRSVSPTSDLCAAFGARRLGSRLRCTMSLRGVDHSVPSREFRLPSDCRSATRAELSWRRRQLARSDADSALRPLPVEHDRRSLLGRWPVPHSAERRIRPYSMFGRTNSPACRCPGTPARDM